MRRTVPPTELLEPRRLFAGAVLSGHTLVVTGATAGNTIVVGLAAGGTEIDARVSYAAGKATKTTDKLFLVAGITGLRVTGGPHADTITIDQTYGAFPVPATLIGGAGNDVITGGNENDSILGNAGADMLNGGIGNDTIYGGPGNDTLIGSDGDDLLFGQGGHDLILGGNGNDTLYDAVGPDTLYGGAGDNTFDIHAPKKDLTDYDSTKDTLKIVQPPSQNNNDDDGGGILGELFPITRLF